MIDSKVSNFMYVPAARCSILDHHLAHSHSRLEVAIADLRGPLCRREWSHIPHGTPEYEAQELERFKHYLPILVRYLRLLESHHPDLLDKWRNLVRGGYSSPVNREYIPHHPDLEAILNELEELGF